MSFNRNTDQDELATRRMMLDPSKAMIGDKSWLDHGAGAALVDQMLLYGVTKEQLLASGRKWGAIQSHLHHLKSDHGLGIEKHEGVYRFAYPEVPYPSDQAPADSGEPPAIAPDAVKPKAVPGAKDGDTLRQIFAEALAILELQAQRTPDPGLQRELAVLQSREWPRITRESEILNRLVVQTALHGPTRKVFRVFAPEQMHRFDQHYHSRFFSLEQRPEYDASGWEGILLAWGQTLLSKDKAEGIGDLASLVERLQQSHKGDWKSYTKQPRSRLFLTLATALSKLKTELFTDPDLFLDQHQYVSQRHPGRAYDRATRFATGIIEAGNPLIRNFFIDLGLVYYAQVDVALGDFLDDLSFGHKFTPKERFILGWLLAQEVETAPFFLDKLLRTGADYCKGEMKALFERHRADYRSSVSRLAAGIASYR